MRVLLLQDKAQDEAGVEAARDDVQERLTASGLTWEVVTAGDAFRHYEGQVGGRIRGYRWTDWVTHAGSTFDGFVRPYTETLGRINAEIAELALALHKPVVFLPDSGGAQAVMGVQTRDPEDFKGGWCLLV